MSDALPVHSPLGASSAERWLNCPGSVALIQTLGIPDTTDEPDYQRDGTAAHEIAAKSLQQGRDAWEWIGETAENGVVITAEHTDGVQMYLDHCRPLMDHGEVYIEHRVSSPAHRALYGTVDFAVIAENHLDIRDYKNGAGVTVDADDNPQLMYYAFGVLQGHDDVRTVDVGIVQPNAFHQAGPIRVWSTTAEHIHGWANDTLIPAMLRTEMDAHLDAGPWCRFCPAKLICPQMTSLFGAACTSDSKHIGQLSDASLGRSYQYIQAVKQYTRALEEETFKRLNNGRAVAGVKLVHKRANRVWHPDAAVALQAQFGQDAFTVPEMKSPAELEKLGLAAKAFVKEHAFTPASGLTVAMEDDQRLAVKVQKTAEVFGVALQKLLTAE